MTPLGFLSVVVAMTALAVGSANIQRRRQRRSLEALAAQLKLHYSVGDCFRLAPRVALSLSVPGAAAVRVHDLMYGLEERSGYRYFFRTEYTVGVLRGKTTVRKVAMFCEPKDAPAGAAIELVFAPESLPLAEQYRHLHDASFVPSTGTPGEG
jgi:hypothetical protein